MLGEQLTSTRTRREGHRRRSDDGRRQRRRQRRLRAGVPQSFRDRYLERQATFAALTRLVGTDDQGTTELRVLRREARRTGVSVAAAYGRVDPARGPGRAVPHAVHTHRIRAGLAAGPRCRGSWSWGSGRRVPTSSLPRARRRARAVAHAVRAHRAPSRGRRPRGRGGVLHRVRRRVRRAPTRSTTCTRAIVDALRRRRARARRGGVRGAGQPGGRRAQRRAAARASPPGDVVLEVVPGVSFAELAWARLGVDPMDGARAWSTAAPRPGGARSRRPAADRAVSTARSCCPT